MPHRICTLPGVNQCWTQRPTLHSAVLLHQVLAYRLAKDIVKCL